MKIPIMDEKLKKQKKRRKIPKEKEKTFWQLWIGVKLASRFEKLKKKYIYKRRFGLEHPLCLILNVSKNLSNVSLIPNLKGSRRRLKLLLMVLR